MTAKHLLLGMTLAACIIIYGCDSSRHSSEHSNSPPTHAVSKQDDSNNTNNENNHLTQLKPQDTTSQHAKAIKIIITDDIPDGLVFKHKLPIDKLGLSPRDVVLKYLEDIRDDKQDKSIKWWTGKPKSSMPIGYESYYLSMRSVDTYKVGLATKGKSGYWTVWYDAYIGDKRAQVGHSFDLKISDGHWRLVRGYNW